MQESIKRRIVIKAAEIAAQKGWSKETLCLAIEHFDMKRDIYKVLFPLFEKSAISDFIDHINTQMVILYEDKKRDQILGTTAKIKLLLECNFIAMQGHKKSIARIASFCGLRLNFLFANKMIWKVVDNIWRAAEDISYDFNFYTKRASLFYIYKSTFLFWIGQNEKDLENTIEFMQRRMNEVMFLGSVKKKIKNIII